MSCTSRPARGARFRPSAHHGVDQQTMEVRAYAVARALCAASRQYRRRLHRARVPLRRQGDHPGGAGGSLLRQAARPADGRRRLLHQPRGDRSGRHGRPAHAARRRRLHLHHGRAGRGRHHAELPEHILPRRALRALGARAQAGARVRGVAPRAWASWTTSAACGRASSAGAARLLAATAGDEGAQ